MAIDETQLSSLLNYLPAILQESEPDQPDFLGRFLLAYERILLGIGEVSATLPQPGLEEILGGGTIADPDRLLGSQDGKSVKLAGIQRYFEPGVRLQEGVEQLLSPAERTPPEFLSWLASWVAFTLREDWSEAEKRRFISQIVPLYRLRGTKTGLVQMLRAYTGMGVEVNEFIQPLQIGVTATVGVDTMIGGAPPHYFFVKLFLDSVDPTVSNRKTQIARALIEQQKPAHTYYDLKIEIPTMQIGVQSTIGVDTLIGSS